MGGVKGNGGAIGAITQRQGVLRPYLPNAHLTRTVIILRERLRNFPGNLHCMGPH